MPRVQASAILTAVIASFVTGADAVAHAEPLENQINTVRAIRAALRACWAAPPSTAIDHGNMTISVRLSFKQNGEILGVPLITYASVRISEDERRAYRAALDETLARCTPLPFSETFANVIAGRPINVRFRMPRHSN